MRHAPAQLSTRRASITARTWRKKNHTIIQDLTSVKGAAGGELKPLVRVTGQVQLDISYFARSGSLTVHVMQCSQLAPVSKRRNSSNP